MSQLRRIIDNAYAENINALELRGEGLSGLDAELGLYNDYTSRACYAWHKGRGLARVDLPFMTLANTLTVEQALNYISRSHHFGIYLFHNVQDDFKLVSTWATLRKFIADRSEQRKILMFAGTGLRLPDHMQGLFVQHEINIAAVAAPVTALRYG